MCKVSHGVVVDNRVSGSVRGAQADSRVEERHDLGHIFSLSCYLSGGGRSDIFIETFLCSLWWWCELGGATTEVVRDVGSNFTPEVVRAVKGAG